jgi:hypothetical protein
LALTGKPVSASNEMTSSEDAGTGGARRGGQQRLRQQRLRQQRGGHARVCPDTGRGSAKSGILAMTGGGRKAEE